MNLVGKKYFKSIICLNSNIAKLPCSDLPVIAADGAHTRLSKISVIPDYTIGDFDSMIEIQNNHKTKFIIDKDQEYYDFEKCIFLAIELNLYPAIVLGCLGGEFDHSLNNINIFIKYQEKCPMTCFFNNSWATVLDNKLIFQGNIGDIISLIPYPKANISTSGLKWDLTAYDLAIEGKSSARNKIREQQVALEVHTGRVILVSKSLYWL